MFGLGMTEIVIIVVVLGIIFFGGSKITDLAKSAGRFSGEYKKSKAEIESELSKIKEDFKIEESKTASKEEKKEPSSFSNFG
jgi:sec-independent protein translocase protein TatA